MADATGFIWVVPVVNKGFRIGVKPVEAALRADPEETGAVFNNRPDSIIAQAVRVSRIVLVTRELPVFTIEFVEPSHRTHPDRSGTVFINSPYSIVAQAVRIVRLVLVPDKSRPFPGHID